MSDQLNIIVKLKDLFTKEAKKVTGGIDNLGKESKKTSKEIENLNNKTNKTLSGLKKFIAGGVLIKLASGILNVGKNAAITSAEFEQYRITFDTMLGSVEKSTKLLKEIEQFSASTPFQLPGLVVGAKRLLGFGIAADDVVSTIRNLGNAAQGNSVILDRLTLAYGKLRAKGRASLEEINMFTEAGVPIMDALAKKYKITTAELFKLVSAGKVGFEDVDEALRNLTQGQGMFAGIIEKQAASASGLMSTLKDNVGLLAKEFGDVLLPIIKPVVSFFIKLIQTFRKIPPVFKSSILVIGGVTAAIFGLVGGFFALTAAASALGIALNAAFFGIPLLVGLIVSGVVLAIANINKIKIAINNMAISIVKQLSILNKIPFFNIDTTKIIADLEKVNAALIAQQELKEEIIEKTVNLEEDAALKAETRRQLELEAIIKRYDDEGMIIQAFLAKKAQWTEDDAKSFATWQAFMVQSARSTNKEIASIGKALAVYEIGIKTYQAAMGAYNSMVGIPIVGPALGVAAAGAAIAFGAEQAAAVSSIEPGFAEGGIVPGNSFTGDNVKARVNSKEMILDDGQQKELFDIANGRGSSGSGGGGSQTIIVKIGEKTVANEVVNSYNKGRTLGTVTKITTK